MRKQRVQGTQKYVVRLVLACLLVGLMAATATAPSSAGSARAGVAKVTGVKAYLGVMGEKSKISIGWRGAAKAKKYQVFVSRYSNMTSPKVITTRARKVTVTKLDFGRSYCIQVRGVNGKTYGKRSTKICTPAQGKTPWVTGQAHVNTSGGIRTTMQVVWPKVAGATRYEIDYAPSPNGKLVDIQKSGSKKTLTGIKATSASTQTAPLKGLAPGKAYCFQIRPQGTAGYGLRSTRSCKVAMSASRGVPAKSVPLVVGTFNTCSATNACLQAFGDWPARAADVREKVLDMRVGKDGAYADAVAIQEGFKATSGLANELAGTFTLGCQTTGGLQSLFIRDDSAFKLDAASEDFVTFTDTNDPTHGACWVKLEDADGNEVVVVSLHLFPNTGDDGDYRRALQTQLVVDTIRTTYAEPIPIVYAGDFNSHRNRSNDAPGVRLGNVGSEDAYDHASSYLSAPYRNSGCSAACLETGVPSVSSTWGDHIDRVFAPPGAHVSTWEVEERLSGGKYILVSDHNPVVVSMLLPVS